jgi:hypothetical protein
MTELPSLPSFAFTVLAYVACIKLAARLFRRTQLSWRHAWIFGVALFAVLFAVGALVRLLPFESGPLLSHLVYLAIDLVAQLAFGGWFLGPRAKTTEGAPVAFKGGALLSLIAYGLVFSFSVAAAAALPFFARMGVI